MVKDEKAVKLFFYKNIMGYLRKYIYIYIYKIYVLPKGSYLFFKFKYVVKGLLFRRILKVNLINRYIYV